MKNLILAMVVVFASVAAASASEKGQDDTIRTFKPTQETVKIMDHVFEVLR